MRNCLPLQLYFPSPKTWTKRLTNETISTPEQATDHFLQHHGAICYHLVELGFGTYSGGGSSLCSRYLLLQGPQKLIRGAKPTQNRSNYRRGKKRRTHDGVMHNLARHRSYQLSSVTLISGTSLVRMSRDVACCTSRAIVRWSSLPVSRSE